MRGTTSAIFTAVAAAVCAATAGGCSVLRRPAAPPTGPVAPEPSTEVESFDVHDAFMANLARQCGYTFRGRVLNAPDDDTTFAADPPLVMHIRECTEDEVRIPVFVGDDRSRTWIFSRTGGGVDLRHDHRHADGRSEPVTFYGAFVVDTPIAVVPPSATRHEFKRVQDDMISGWVVEIVPGEHYTYGTQRNGMWRHRFQFDLSEAVAPMPDPWGNAPVGIPVWLPRPQAGFMANLAVHCGDAFHGRVTRRPPSDEIFRGDEVLTVHFRECTANRMKLPFHVEANRSRTWVLTATTAGIDLRHDHRHEDGSPEANTWYGAHTQTHGTATRQEFLRELPADAPAGTATTGWAIEIVPNERYTYGTIRNGEWVYRLDFDLSTAVEPPPPPWGH
jgi:hypothetical protein